MKASEIYRVDNVIKLKSGAYYYKIAWVVSWIDEPNIRTSGRAFAYIAMVIGISKDGEPTGMGVAPMHDLFRTIAISEREALDQKMFYLNIMGHQIEEFELVQANPVQAKPALKTITHNTTEQFEKDKKFFFPDLCQDWVSPGVSGLKYL